MKSCFFIGHRRTPQSVLPELLAAVDRHIVEYGVREFVVGNYGEFDRIVVKALLRAKRQYPEIILSLLIPYHPSQRAVQLPAGFDNTFYPPEMEKVPRQYAIVRANRYMVEHADYLIAYAWHPASNATNLVAYAKRREKKGQICVTKLNRN